MISSNKDGRSTMNNTGWLLLRTALAIVAGWTTVNAVAQQAGYSPQVIDEACWEPTFNEEFDKLSLWDSAYNSGIWKTEYIWARDIVINNELQYYIDPRVHGVSPFSISDGVLTIAASKTPDSVRQQVNNSAYVSGVLTTQKDFSQRYGRFETRAKVPAGRGLWPAFWLLPSFDQWPEGVAILPEIDVMEFIGSATGTYHTTVHTNETGELKSYPYDHNNLGDLSSDFHVYSVIWNKERISWYLDGRRMASHRTPADLHEPMHFLLNLAIGGNWAGAPDNSTEFPARYRVDHVRAYRWSGTCH